MEDLKQPTNVTNKTFDLINEFNLCTKRLRLANETCELAKKQLAAAVKQLGPWLVPPDAKDGETFHLWFGDGIIKCVFMGDNSEPEYSIGWRTVPTKVQQNRDL